MIPQKDLSVLQFLNFVGQMTRDNGLLLPGGEFLLRLLRHILIVPGQLHVALLLPALLLPDVRKQRPVFKVVNKIV